MGDRPARPSCGPCCSSSDGDPYLETALSYLPDTELYGVTPDDYGPATKPELFDLIIFEGFLPDELPAKPILAIAPPETSPAGDRDRDADQPGDRDARRHRARSCATST